jgi:hypothetical protein
LVGELVLAVGNDQILLARDVDVVCVAVRIPQLVVFEAALSHHSHPSRKSVIGVSTG